jgi:cobalt-zinc-cadmium efflux system outer membrane protein
VVVTHLIDTTTRTLKRVSICILLLTIFGAQVNSAAITYKNQDEPAADTMQLTLQQSETIFLDSNLVLLSQHYNIDIQRAGIIQAKLWPNPNFSIEHILYSGELKQFFPTGVNDQTSANLSQLILLAGKRNKQVKLAEANVKLSEYQFYDVLRTLKYTLRTDFFNVYYLQQSAKAYNQEITSLQDVVTAFKEQQGKGYVSEKEVVRIRAQLYALQTEYNDLINQINDVESQLRLLLQARQYIYVVPLVDTNAVAALSPATYSLTTLLDSAYTNRTDLLMAKANTDIYRLNYIYQKSLATPDLSANLSYDEQGSYLTNYFGVGVSMDLPFFSRNQGNIKSAKSSIDVARILETSTEDTVKESVTRSLQKAYAQQKLYNTIDSDFVRDFQRLLQGVLDNYKKRNIGLLDFLDFYDSYKENVLQLNNILYNRIQAFEDLNYYTGTDFFNE